MIDKKYILIRDLSSLMHISMILEDILPECSDIINTNDFYKIKKKIIKWRNLHLKELE